MAITSTCAGVLVVKLGGVSGLISVTSALSQWIDLTQPSGTAEFADPP